MPAATFSDSLSGTENTTMAEQTTISNARILRMGPDVVTVSDTKVIIDARREMPEWEVVRGMRPPSVYFEDKRYLLVEKTPGAKPFEFRYVLHPWPPGKESNPNQFFDYNAEAVAERDAGRLAETSDAVIWTLLLLVYPFLGLLWSRMQERLVRFGFIPRTLTGVSIFATFCLLFTQLVMISVMINGSARSGKMMIGGIIVALTGHNNIPLGPLDFPLGLVDAALLLAMIVDAAMRYTHYLRESEWTGGFLEWLFSKPSHRN